MSTHLVAAIALLIPASTPTPVAAQTNAPPSGTKSETGNGPAANFSGRWTLAPPANAPGTAMGSAPPSLSAQGDMGSGWGADLTLTQDATALTVEYTYFHPREIQPPFRFRYLLDGSQSRNSVNLGRGPQEYVRAVIRDISKSMEQNNYRFSSLVMAIVNSDTFQQRRSKRGEANVEQYY